MKEGFDKEIDSLLRRRARGAMKSFAGGGAPAAAPAHLDADELGAFAEGALPAPARLAAVSHLADCDRCRSDVVALSRALGGGAELKQALTVPASTETKRPATWRAWAAALFSPRVLRFAAPALALSVVAVVSFVALRTRDAGALREPTNARSQIEVSNARPEAGAPATASMANVNPEGLVAQNPQDASRDPAAAAAPPRPPSAAGQGTAAGESQPAPVGAATEDASAPPPPPTSSASPEAGSGEMAKAAPRPAVVEEPEQPAKSDNKDKEKSARGGEAADEVAANDLAVQQRRGAQSRANEVQMPDGGSRGGPQKRGADNNSSNIYGGNAGTSAAAPRESERDDRGGGAAASRRARAEQKAEADDERRGVETREAAGHRFRREGSAWVDVKYKPSMPSTGVKRGTEAFRALVADLPIVGRVAGQIGGEVVVVVSGRAYRIR